MRTSPISNLKCSIYIDVFISACTTCGYLSQVRFGALGRDAHDEIDELLREPGPTEQQHCCKLPPGTCCPTCRRQIPLIRAYHSSRRTCAGGNTESTRAARRQQHAPARPLRVRTSWRTHPTRVALPTPAPVPYHSSWRGRHDEWYPRDLRWSDERGHQC